MTQRTVITRNEQETRDLALQLLACVRGILATEASILIGLSGDLGMGKSVFARAFVRGFVSDEALNVPSPTFTLVQYYEAGGQDLYHYDLYRLSDPDEIYELGWEDSLAGGVSLVEWPQRLMGMKPVQMLDISIAQGDNDSERIFTLPNEFAPLKD